jgi:hypothetical protein
MANPILNMDHGSGEPTAEHLYCEFTATTSGAVPTSLTRAREFRTSSIAVVKPSGTGLYDFFLKEPWAKLLDWSCRTIQASYSASGACYGEVTVDNVATVAAPKVRVTFFTAAGAAVDLATGDIVRLRLDLQNLVG